MRQNCQIRFYCRLYWRHYASRKSPPQTPLPQTTCTNNVLYGVPSSQPFILGSDIAPCVLQLLKCWDQFSEILSSSDSTEITCSFSVKCKRCYPGTCGICVGWISIKSVYCVLLVVSQLVCFPRFNFCYGSDDFDEDLMILVVLVTTNQGMSNAWECFFWSYLIPPSISGTNRNFPRIEISQKWKPCKCGISENHGFDKGPVCKRAL